MKKKRLLGAGVAALTLGLVASACSAPSADDGDGGGNSSQPTSVNLGWNQPMYSYNENTSNGNATANSVIKYLMNDQFWYVDEAGDIQANTSFGTYEATSDDPLTVEYTVGDDTVWSDGTPVTAADLLLTWAAQSGNVNTVSGEDVKRDEATGNAQTKGDTVYFDSSSIGLALVKDVPEIGEDGKTFTMTYTKPFADWQYDMSIPVPAHVVAMKALGIDDAQEATDRLVTAITAKNNADLAKIARFWNTGFDYTALPDDPALALSSGAYTMKDFKENQYVTLEANDKYKGDHAASIDQVTVRWNEDPLAQVQALENGEIDLFSPQVTSDVVKAAEAVQDSDIQTGVEGTYEHIDLVMNNGGPFDPETYGGDAAKATQVRKAFLHGVPRQEIVDKLVKPINPDAEVRNSFLRTQGATGYDEIAAQNGSSEYAETDPALSKQLLQEAGVQTPIDVRVMYAADNVRRANEFQLLKPALAEAGFNLIDAKNADWGAKLGDGTYDAVFFGWQSTTNAVSADAETFKSNGLNNLIGYNSPEVNKLFDELVVTDDEAKQIEIQTQIEQQLYDDAIGITLFQFPSATISNKSRIENVKPGILNPTMFYGFWDWTVPGS